MSALRRSAAVIIDVPEAARQLLEQQEKDRALANSQRSGIVLCCEVPRDGVPCGRVAPAEPLNAVLDGTEVIMVTCVAHEAALARRGWTVRRP